MILLKPQMFYLNFSVFKDNNTHITFDKFIANNIGQLINNDRIALKIDIFIQANITQLNRNNF